MLLMVLSATAVSLSAQERPVLHGRMLEAGQPIANQPVKLHRVTNDGQGFTIDSTVTDTNGRFELRVDQLSKAGLLFAAPQYKGKLYIGNTFQQQLPTTEYQLMVGVGATPIEFEN